MVVCGSAPPKTQQLNTLKNVLAQGEGARGQQHQRIQLLRAEQEGDGLASEESSQTHAHAHIDKDIAPASPSAPCVSLPRLASYKAYFRDLRSSIIILYWLTYMRFASSRLIPFSFDQASHFAFPA